ncbi:MAG: TetR/AcrR family transcriptional regulator [Cyclobacteriaceae bacterium]|nr:TetR/AcrR family transcriptional regulator [Cyclobacteriaceae bacterium]
MAKQKRDNSTEKAILVAARKVFTRRGYAAARMEEIAREAGINRALLHYYFRSKEKMFDLIFEERMKEFFLGLAGIVNGPLSLDEKIRAIVRHDIDMISAQPDLPIFIMQELAQNPERMVGTAQRAGMNPGGVMKAFFSQVKTAVDEKKIRPIEGGQLLINVMSMSVYPFIAKPVIKLVQGMDDTQFDRMMERRKEEVAQFVIDALKP